MMTNTLNQGTTLSWTEGYGEITGRRRMRELLRDAFFVTTVVLFVSGVAGFVAYERPVGHVSLTQRIVRLL